MTARMRPCAPNPMPPTQKPAMYIPIEVARAEMIAPTIPPMLGMMRIHFRPQLSGEHVSVHEGSCLSRSNSLVRSLGKRCGKCNSEDDHRQRWPRGEPCSSNLSSDVLSKGSSTNEDDQFTKEQAEDGLSQRSQPGMLTDNEYSICRTHSHKCKGLDMIPSGHTTGFGSIDIGRGHDRLILDCCFALTHSGRL